MEYWGIDWTPENATEYLSDFSLWMLFWNIVRRRDWQPDNDGAYACKAQALFIKRHGKEKFLMYMTGYMEFMISKKRRKYLEEVWRKD